MGIEGFEPSRLLKSTDFKSIVSTISPYPQRRYPDSNWRFTVLQSDAFPLGYIAFIYTRLIFTYINFIITIYTYIYMKLKTKKSVSKRIKNKNPIFIKKKANKSHLLRKKNSSQLRRLSESSLINIADIKAIKLMLPYYKK